MLGMQTPSDDGVTGGIPGGVGKKENASAAGQVAWIAVQLLWGKAVGAVKKLTTASKVATKGIEEAVDKAIQEGAKEGADKMASSVAKNGIEEATGDAGHVSGLELKPRMVNPYALHATKELSSKSQAAKMSKLMGGEKGFGPFDPIDAIESKGELYITNGHHRTAAAIRARLRAVPVIVRPVSSAEEALELIRAWAATQRD